MIASLVLSLALQQAPVVLGPGGIACPAGQAVQVLTGTREKGRCVAVGSASPAGTTGTIQVKSGTSLGAFAGSTCSAGQYASSVSGAGALTCSAPTAAPVGAKYVTTAADATLTAEVVLPTCSSGQHLFFDGTTVSCTVDAGSTGGPTRTILVSDTATSACGTWTTMMTSPTYAAGATATWECYVRITVGPVSQFSVSEQLTVTTSATVSTFLYALTAGAFTAVLGTGLEVTAIGTTPSTRDVVSASYGVAVMTTSGTLSLRRLNTCGNQTEVMKAGSFCLWH